MLEFEDWGRVPYAEAWERQRAYFRRRLEAKTAAGSQSLPDCLVFCEHSPVLTLGNSGKAANLLVPQAMLESRGVEYFKIDRGGDITYHGPGQITGYPILDLDHFGRDGRPLGLKDYIWRLEEAVIRFIARFGLEGGRVEGATGVWLDGNGPKARKICAIGVKASRYVTMHGFALNINTDLSYFRLINPCGFVDKGVTSLQAELGAPQDMERCKALLREELSALFPTT